MATTPNYGWVMPDPTDFVTSLPADFEIFGDAVDATVDGIETTANAALPETIIDAAGDLIYGSAADTAARLAIGTAGQVLTVNSGATAPEWAAPAGGGLAWTLLNSGGTALTGATTVTVSGLSASAYHIIIQNASSANAQSTIQIRFNTDTANHYPNGFQLAAGATYNAANQTAFSAAITGAGTGYAILSLTANTAVGQVSGYCSVLNAAETTNPKMYFGVLAGSESGSNSHNSYSLGGIYAGTSAITSISVVSSTGNLDNGTIYIYGGN